MAVKHPFSGISSVEDALKALQKRYRARGGRQLVLCCSERALLMTLVDRLRRASDERKTMLVACSSSEPFGKHVLRIADFRSVPQASRSIRHALRTMSSNGILFVVAPKFPPYTHSLRRQQEFIRSLLSIIAHRNLLGVWCIARSAMESSATAMLKDAADLFFDFFDKGDRIIAQCTAARDFYTPDFFLPQLLTVTPRSLHLAPLPLAATRKERHDAERADPLEPYYRPSFERAAVAMVLFDLRSASLRLNQQAREFVGVNDLDARRLSTLIPNERRFAFRRSLVLLRKKGKLTFSTTLNLPNGNTRTVVVFAVALGRNMYAAVCRDTAEQEQAQKEKERLEHTFATFLASLPFPYAVFANRKVVEHNSAFTTLFPWTEQRTPTLSEFFGRRNEEFLREIAQLEREESGAAQITGREVLIPAPGRKRVAVEVTITCIPYFGRKALYCTFVDVSARRDIIDRAAAVDRKFAALLEGSLDAITITKEGTFLLVNEACARLFGYKSPRDLIGKKLSSIVWGRSARGVVVEKESQLLRGSDERHRFEFPGKRKDGSKILVEVQSSAIVIDGAKAVLSYLRDVTERKREEEQLDRQVRALEVLDRFTREIHAIASTVELYPRALNAARRLTSFEAGGIVLLEGDTLVLRYHHGLSETLRTKLDRQHLHESFARYFHKTHAPVIGSIQDYPPHLPFKSLFEAEGYTAIALLPILVDERFVGIFLIASKHHATFDEHDRTVLTSLGTQLSIAVQQAHLREQAERAGQHLQWALESLNEVLYTLQPNGALVSISPNIERMTGYRHTDFQQNPNLWRSLLHPDDRPVLSQRISNQASSIDCFTLEYRVLPKGKATYRWLRDVVRYERASDGSLRAIQGILSDVTAEKALSATRDLTPPMSELSATPFELIECLPHGVALIDSTMTCSECNEVFARTLGSEKANVVGKSVHDFPALQRVLRDLLERAQDSAWVETTCSFPDESGGERTLRVHVRRRRPSDASAGFVLLVEETSALKRMEDALHESEAALSAALDASSDAIVIADLHGKLWAANRTFRELTGHGTEESLAGGFPYLWIASEDRERFMVWWSGLTRTNDTVPIDVSWYSTSGGRASMRMRARVVANAQGEPAAVLLAAEDRTELRRVSFALDWKDKQLDLLNRIISYANTTMDLGSIFATIASEIHALVPYDGISITLLDEEQHLLPWYMAVPTSAGEPECVSYLPVDAALIYDAVRSSSPAIKRTNEDAPMTFNAQISIPLSVEGTVVGAVSLLNAHRDAFGKEELTFLQPVVEQIGAIIQRVRLFERVRSDSSYVRNLLDSINHIIFTVDHQYRITHVNKAWKEYMVRVGKDIWASEEHILGQSLEVLMPDPPTWEQYKRIMDDLFERRIQSYARKLEVQLAGEPTAYHLVISPMSSEGKVTGLVFTQTDITDIQRTEAEIKRRNQELITLNTISSSITKSLDLDEIVRVASSQIREMLNATTVVFYLQNDHEELEVAGNSAMTAELTDLARDFAASRSLEALFGAIRKPILVADEVVTTDPLLRVAAEMRRGLRLRTAALVPLQSKERVTGAFLIGFAQPRSLTDHEEQLLILIGNQIGAAVENGRLYAEVQRQVQTLMTLYELGKGLTGSLDLNSMLQVVYREVTKALPVERFYYHAYLPEENTLTLLSRTVNGVAEFYPASVKVQALSQWPNSIYQELVANATSYLGPTSEDAQDSMIAVPIKSNDRVVGIISIVSSQPRAYNFGHLRLLESIANLTGVAIGKAMLYEDTLKKSIEIENRNKELDDFTYVVSHDLKEPLISIEGYSKIVMQDYHTLLDQEGKEYLSAVVHSTARMKHLIDDLLTLSRLGRTNEPQEIVSVKKIVDDILHDFQFSLRQRHVVVHVQENLPSVRFSSTRLSMVFRNLISNAMKFNDKPQPIIDIGFDEDEHDYRFWVKDNGIGIESQYFERIFAIFQRLNRSEEYRGTGAGLTIVKKIIDREGGRIWVESTPGVGSTFFFTIRKPA